MTNRRRSLGLVKLLLPVFGGALLVVNLSPVMATATPAPHLSPPPPGAAGPAVAATIRNLPLSFIKNQGQVDQRVKFYTQLSQSSLYFTSRELVLSLSPQPGMKTAAGSRERRRSTVLRLVPEGMSPRASLAGVDRQQHRVNYFVGNAPGRWRTGVPTFRAVAYREAYPGIDLQFYGTGGALEYDIIVKPGGNPDRVKFHCPGARGLSLTPEGDLAIQLTDGGVLVQKKPVIYQEINGVRVPVAGRFKVLGPPGRCRYGFQVAAYDRRHSLVIDPVLAFSTFLGGSGEDRGQAIAVDSAGNVYVTGYTTILTPPNDFPTWPDGSPLRPYVAGNDAFVTKIKADLSGFVYSTFLGGSGSDEGCGIAVDASGHAYVTGFTGSTNFPTAPLEEPLFPYRGNGDAFVAKISPDGSALVYSTYLGGSNVDRGLGIAVDGQQHAYVTGYTLSSTFPTMPSDNPLRPFGGFTDAFVTKINADATALLYSTFLGGGGNDRAWAIAVDTSGSAYITGQTNSTDFPTWPDGAPLLPYGGKADAFVTKINAGATALIFSTFLGGTGDDYAYGIAVDSGNHVFVTGETENSTFPAVPAGAPLRPYGGDSDAFVTKIKADASQVLFSTFLGGSSSDAGYAVAVDRVGDPYVTGYTESANFPTWPSGQPLFPKSGDMDTFITKIKGNGSSLGYSTFMGGTYVDVAFGIAVDKGGSAYITGHTNSTGNGSSTPFPQRLPLQGYGGGTRDAFVAKIAEPHDLSWIMLLLLD